MLFLGLVTDVFLKGPPTPAQLWLSHRGGPLGPVLLLLHSVCWFLCSLTFKKTEFPQVGSELRESLLHVIWIFSQEGEWKSA